MKKTLLLLAFLIANITVFAQIELTDDNAEEKLLVNNDRLIVLEFYADWCGYCKKMKPIMSQLVNAYDDNVDFYKINVDESQVDDALGISSYPTYIFIKNSSNVEQLTGAQSKEYLEGLIELYMKKDQESSNSEEEYSVWTLHDEPGELRKDNYQHIWDDSSKLNSLAWHVYKEHSEQYDFIRAIDIVKRSIELDANYYNLDTHAALLYKTKNYTEAIKKAVEAIEVAKANDLGYTSTLELIEMIIEAMK